MRTGICIGGAQIKLQRIQFGTDIFLDEIQFDANELCVKELCVKEVTDGQRAIDDQKETDSERAIGNETAIDRGVSGYRVDVSETTFMARISEPNLNSILAKRLTENSAVRNVQLNLLSGKARVTGHLVKSVLSLPFMLEAVPILENGVRVGFDFQTARVGIKIPGALLEVIERVIAPSLTLDLSQSLIPLCLEEIRCEPGRLTVRGRARVQWPPVQITPPPAPFTAVDRVG